MRVGLVRDIDAVQIVRLVEIRIAVVRGDEQLALPVMDALNLLRYGLQVHLAQVFAGVQAVFINITPAFLAYPGDHPYRALVGIDANAGHFLLSAGRLEAERALELERFSIVNGNLDILADAVHEILGTDKNFAVENVDAANVIGRNRVAVKRRLIGKQQLAVLVVLVECFAAADVVVIAVAGNALTPP